MATVPGTPMQDTTGGIPRELQPTQADMLMAAAIMHQQGGFQVAGDDFGVGKRPVLHIDPMAQGVPQGASPKGLLNEVPQHAVMEGRTVLTKTKEPQTMVDFAAKYNLSNEAMKSFIDDNFSSPKYRASVYQQFLDTKGK